MQNIPQGGISTQDQATVMPFEYWDEAPHEWAHSMDLKMKEGESFLTLPILWGIHETNRGVFDFSKQSRLRVERVLSLAQAKGIKVSVVLGFPAHKQSFPEWAWNSKNKENIPRKVWEKNAPYYSSLSVPSLLDVEIKESFKSFIREVATLLSLYREPEGPIERISLSLIPLKHSQSLCRYPQHASNVEKRYEKIERFNERFQTNYRNFHFLNTAAGCKFIEEKRPWLFSFDYQWSRQQVTLAFAREILQLEEMESLRELVHIDDLNNQSHPDLQNRKFAISFDPVLVQPNQSQLQLAGDLHPFWAEGLLHTSTIQSFQWMNWLLERTQEKGIAFLPLPCFEADEVALGVSVSNHIVICGKYQARASRKMLELALQRGGCLFFPFGLPQYDENQETLDWLTGGKREIIKGKGNDFNVVRFPNGGNIVTFPTQAMNPLNELSLDKWESFYQIADQLFEHHATFKKELAERKNV